jgi:hypothetical protein
VGVLVELWWGAMIDSYSHYTAKESHLTLFLPKSICVPVIAMTIVFSGLICKYLFTIAVDCSVATGKHYIVVVSCSADSVSFVINESAPGVCIACAVADIAIRSEAVSLFAFRCAGEASYPRVSNNHSNFVSDLLYKAQARLF